MEPQYFAQVTDGVVTDVRKTTWDFLQENPNLYPGLWMLVESPDQYPAIGWSWTVNAGFTPPIPVGE